MSTSTPVDASPVDHIDQNGLGLDRLRRRVGELEAQVTQLEEAMNSRQHIGLITGLLAERFRLNPDEAWSVMVRLSSRTNLKVREVTRVLRAGYFGQLAQEDLALAARLNEHLPPGGRISIVSPQTTTEPGHALPAES